MSKMHREKIARIRRETADLLKADMVICNRCHLPLDLASRKKMLLLRNSTSVKLLPDNEPVVTCSKCGLPTMVAVRLQYVDSRPYASAG